MGAKRTDVPHLPVYFLALVILVIMILVRLGVFAESQQNYEIHKS